MKITQNRELSWLKFNKRVLDEANDPKVPILERAKFLSIFTSNLDEFFMIRCGSLYDLSLIDDEKKDKKSDMTPSQQLDTIFKACKPLYDTRNVIYKDIQHILQASQLSCISFKQLTKSQEKYVKHYFDESISPLLAPQIIDSHHPFPHLANKNQYVFLKLQEGQEIRYGIVGIPNFINRVIEIPDCGHNYMLLEQIIYHYASRIFKGTTILFKTILRLTRNADITLNENDMDDDDDYRDYMKNILKKRSRLAAIRLEIYKYEDHETIAYLCSHLHLKKEQVFLSKTPLDLSYIFDIIAQIPQTDTSTLLYPNFIPRQNPFLSFSKPKISQIFNHDVLMFYPYQNIDAFLDLLKEASLDKHVVSIKITIYRLAKHSKIVRYLCSAAEAGKEVTVLMELRARFDEQNNISAAETLEEAGCHIIYGFENYKVHSKICLITYKDKNTYKYITQIGTGNYNEKTSKMYTDLSYMTSNTEIANDAIHFFQNISLSNLKGQYNHLWVAPSSLKESILKNIDEQIQYTKINQNAKIFIKMNSLTDLEIINRLVKASQSGVKITMFIRGICCLLPGIKGYTDHIEIYSIVGRFLEHSRIYCFQHKDSLKIYISSADFMTRNTEKRVEIACPIYDRTCQKQILNYIEILKKDNTKVRKLDQNGHYIPIETNEAPFNSQEECIKLAAQMEKERQEKTNKLQELIKKLRHH